MEAKKERFEHLIAYLTQLNKTDPGAFSLREWLQADSRTNLLKALEEWPERHKKGQPLNCGTTACLVGHLPVAFPGDFTWRDLNHTEIVNYVMTTEVPDLPSRTKVGEAVLCEYFGGTENAWTQIIYPRWYDTAQPVKLTAVLERLKELYDTTYGS